MVEPATEQCKCLVEVIGTIFKTLCFETHTHSDRVYGLVKTFCEYINFTSDDLFIASKLHDIGKYSFAKEIFTENKPLKPFEREYLQHHVDVGVQILKDLKFNETIITICHQHHENIDGSGYPLGLTCNEILYESKILRICDAYDAMISRAYSKTFRDVEYALDLIKKDINICFDNELSKQFIDFIYTTTQHQ